VTTTIQILPGTGRGTIRRMVEGSCDLPAIAADMVLHCPSTGFAGPPPRFGEEWA
jgi:hypothetical protein